MARFQAGFSSSKFSRAAPTMPDWKRGEENFPSARRPLEFILSAASNGSRPVPTAETAPQPAMTTSRIQRQVSRRNNFTVAGNFSADHQHGAKAAFLLNLDVQDFSGRRR